MREILKSGSEGGAGQSNVPFLPLSSESSATITHGIRHTDGAASSARKHTLRRIASAHVAFFYAELA